MQDRSQLLKVLKDQWEMARFNGDTKTMRKVQQDIRALQERPFKEDDLNA